jgi:hypothetical protein
MIVVYVYRGASLVSPEQVECKSICKGNYVLPSIPVTV